MITRSNILTIPALLVPLIVGCAYEIDKDRGSHESLEEISIVGFDFMQEKVLSQSCTGSGCHDALWPPDVSDYNSAVDYSKEIYDRVIVKREMPPSPRSLTDEEYDIIKRWFEDGKQQFTQRKE